MELWPTLPEDFRVSTYICLGSGGLLLALYLVGRLLTWGRNSSLPGLMVAGGVVAMVGGVSLYLDQQPTLPGVVEAKTESIDVSSEGDWSHVLNVRVRYTPPEASEPQSRDLRADTAVYDRVTVGDAVEVRYLDLGGWFTFARLSDRSTLSILLGAHLWPLIPIAIAALLLFVLWQTSHSDRKGAFLLSFAGIVVFVFLINSVPQWRAAWPLSGAQATAVATVREVERFTEVGGGDETEPEPLAQPFDLVQVTFVPEGRRDPVLAADMIDAGTLSLEPGGTVAIRYLVDEPRTVRLVGGARSYVWKNTLWAIVSMMFVFLLLGGIWLWSWLQRQVRGLRRDDGLAAAG